MSDVSNLALVVVAALVLVIAYAIFQFRRSCQEHERRKSEGDNTTGRHADSLNQGWNGTRPTRRL